MGPPGNSRARTREGHSAFLFLLPNAAGCLVFTFLHTWNEFLRPLIVIDDLGKKTLPTGLAHFQGPFLTEWHMLMAASVIVMVPVLIVFVIGRRYFVRGIALSSLKA